METSDHSTAQNGKERSTSFQEDFPASLFPKLESEKEQTTTATSGQRCFGLYERYDPHGSLLRMFVGSLLCKTEWYSRQCVLTWKPMVMKFNRFVFQLVPLVLPTDEIDSGLLLTPTGVGIDSRSDEAMEKRQKYRNSIGRNTNPPGNLAEQLARGGVVDMRLLPTIRVSSANGASQAEVDAGNPKLRLETEIAMLPTPTTQEVEHPQAEIQKGRRRTKDGKDSHSLGLADRVAGVRGGHKLQPAFAAWMMGFPENWTELPYQNGVGNLSKPTEMP